MRYISILILALVFTSCEDYLGGDFNADPNNPVTVPVSAQMPAIQIAMVDNYNGDFSRLSCMLTQQVEGVARQWSSFNSYTGLTPNRFDDAWRNTYENVLNEIQIAKAASTEQGLNHYLGILNVMEAYTLMMATDVWDAMPYSDAFKGLEATNPNYDSQDQIYAAVSRLLDEAITLLQGAPGPVSPGGDDVFFGGDAGAWVKAATATKARGKLHLGDYSGAMADAMGSIESADENWEWQYPDANAASNWYRFNRDRTGDLEFHPTMRNIMQSADDTMRLAVMDQIFDPSHTYLTPNYTQEMISFREVMFIIAECDFQVDGALSDAGYEAMLDGVQASFARLGLSDDDFNAYAASGNLPASAAETTLEDIMTQKYIAMFLQPEVYNDYRRTNIPNLTPVSGSNVPVRWHYSSDEYLFNSNSPSETEVNIYTDKVGWDN
jgi:hypothetical protein